MIYITEKIDGKWKLEKGLGKVNCWGWGIVVLQGAPDPLILHLSDTTPPGTTNIKH